MGLRRSYMHVCHNQSPNLTKPYPIIPRVANTLGLCHWMLARNRVPKSMSTFAVAPSLLLTGSSLLHTVSGEYNKKANEQNMQETQSKRKHNHYDIVDLMGESRRFQIGWSLLWVDHCHVYWVDKWKVYFEAQFSFGSEHLSQPEIMSWPKKKTSLCFWASLTSAVAPTVSTQTGYNLKIGGPWSRNRTIWGCSGKMWLWQLTQSSTRTTTGLCPCRMTSLCWSLLNLLIWTSTLRPAWPSQLTPPLLMGRLLWFMVRKCSLKLLLITDLRMGGFIL